MQISGTFSLAAGASNDSVLEGTILEILPGDGVLQFGFNTDCPAANTADILVDVIIGTEVIAVGFQPTNDAKPPIFPDHITLQHPGMAGERLIVKVRNAGAAARRTYWTVIFDRS